MNQRGADFTVPQYISLWLEDYLEIKASKPSDSGKAYCLNMKRSLDQEDSLH